MFAMFRPRLRARKFQCCEERFNRRRGIHYSGSTISSCNSIFALLFSIYGHATDKTGNFVGTAERIWTERLNRERQKCIVCTSMFLFVSLYRVRKAHLKFEHFLVNFFRNERSFIRKFENDCFELLAYTRTSRRILVVGNDQKFAETFQRFHDYALRKRRRLGGERG